MSTVEFTIAGVRAETIFARPMVAPSAEVQAAMFGPSSRIVRKVEIYNPDGTVWEPAWGVVDGNVTVDQGRSERRMCDLTLPNFGNRLKSYPGGFWYDKIIKVFRGVEYDQGAVWITQIGEFMIDSIRESSTSKNVQVSCRDYTKKLLTSKFGTSTTFATGLTLEGVIKIIAQNGGISKFILPTTGKTITEKTFERGTERWNAIHELALVFNYEVFFDAQGYLVLAPQQDPVTSPLIWEFKTGPGGSLVTWEKSTNDTRVYNHVAVTGERTDLPPLYAEAKNTETSSPTRISAIGERTYTYVSSFFDTQAQVQDLANTWLKTYALESFEINMSTIVVPWLDVGNIVRFSDPDPAPGDPTRFLLSSFSIPMKLGAMNPVAKRVTRVG